MRSIFFGKSKSSSALLRDHIKVERQEMLRWQVVEQFSGTQPPDRRKGIEIWMGVYQLKIQKKIDSVYPEKQSLLQFSIDTLKAEIREACEAKEKLHLF